MNIMIYVLFRDHFDPHIWVHRTDIVRRTSTFCNSVPYHSIPCMHVWAVVSHVMVSSLARWPTVIKQIHSPDQNNSSHSTAVLLCTVNYSHSTVAMENYSATEPKHTILYHAAKEVVYITIVQHALRYNTIPHSTIPYQTIPYHPLPYHTIPYHTVPYHAK